MASKTVKKATELLRRIAKVGRKYPAHPRVNAIEPFQHYYKDGALTLDRLDRRDGGVTRREALTRFLLVSAVVDQGPDIEGIRDLVVRVTNLLYTREIRFIHRPLDFFESINISVDRIHSIHEAVKAVRADAWAKKMGTSSGKYNLYMDGASQSLSYAIFRWGVPLALPYLLTKRSVEAGGDGAEALLQYLRGQTSTEQMTIDLKDNTVLGLGKAIGDKAAHLFGKWVTYSYPLLTSTKNPKWGQWSYEVPFDSNAGRVLYRTGFLGLWASKAEYRDNEVLQKGQGKEGKTYLRVTNMRGMRSTTAERDTSLLDGNERLCVRHLGTHRRRPTAIQVQRIPSLLSLLDGTFCPGEIDDGLIRIGTTWCLNTGTPDCKNCPVSDVCEGARTEPSLIKEVRT